MDLKVTKQPDGSFVAIDADNYDADHNGERFVSKSPVGYGRTQVEAIKELLADIEERSNART